MARGNGPGVDAFVNPGQQVFASGRQLSGDDDDGRIEQPHRIGPLKRRAHDRPHARASGYGITFCTAARRRRTDPTSRPAAARSRMIAQPPAYASTHPSCPQRQ